MKKGLLLLLVAFAFGMMSFSTATEQKEPVQKPNIEQLIPDAFKGMSADELLNMSPREYKKLTGQKLSIKEAIALKAAQKQIKKHFPAEGAGGEKPDKSVYIILAIFISFVGVGLATDWKGNDWIINLILSLLCWIPGVIHALIKMKDYYGS